MVERIVVIGDSNAYGFDPHTGRYKHPWPSLLQEEVLNLGMNGMLLSHVNQFVVSRLQNDDFIIVELGSNDVLNGMPMEYVEKKLDDVIEKLKKYKVIYLIPKDLKGYPSLVSLFLSKDINYIDLNVFEIDMSFDGIHFSQKGHEQVADIIKKSALK